MLIIDATHTKAHYNHKKPQKVLRERSKALRKMIYQCSEDIKAELPSKPQEDTIESELSYTQELISIIENHDELTGIPAISQKLNYLKEAVEDDLEHLKASVKEEARVGHKTADTAFYGYKEHLAMTDERIITACVVTSGEKSDGPFLEELYHKSKKNGVEIEAIIGDKAYSGKDNIQFTKREHVHLVVQLHPAVSRGFLRKEDEFFYRLFVCPEGHMAVRKARTGRTNGKYNSQETHYFDVTHCQSCLSKVGCYKEGSKSKTYSITLKSDEHLFQKRFQGTSYFKEKVKHRYKIEAKNAELKHRHGLDVARASGLFNMELQVATTIFVVNMKRIITLINKK